MKMPWIKRTVSTVTIKEIGTRLLMTIIQRPQLVKVSIKILSLNCSSSSSTWGKLKPRYSWVWEISMAKRSARYPKNRPISVYIKNVKRINLYINSQISIRIHIIWRLKDLLVEHGFHGWILDSSGLRVLHNLRLVPCVDNHADDPLRVLERRAS